MGSSPVGSNYLVVADTSDNAIIQKIGPVVGGTGLRPFTIDSEETLAFITIDGLLGFNVGDMSTGKILYAVHVAGFPACSLTIDSCSHGISLSPDDREIYVVDTANNYVHVFDVTGLPGSAPVQVADIPLAHPFTANGAWATHSVDGRFVIIGESGDVIDTATRTIVGYIPTLNQSKEFTEVDFQNGIPYFSPLSRSGVGYHR
jgi:DNA-binding beta-propeller fold protein YncE